VERVDDAKEPAPQAAALLPEVPLLDRPLERVLDQVVGGIGIAGEAAGEAPEMRDLACDRPLQILQGLPPATDHPMGTGLSTGQTLLSRHRFRPGRHFSELRHDPACR